MPIVVLFGLLALACSCGSDGREASEMPSEDTIPMIPPLHDGIPDPHDRHP